MHIRCFQNSGTALLCTIVAAGSLVSAINAEIPCGYEVTAIIQGPWCNSTFGYPPTTGMDITGDQGIVGYYRSCDIGPFRAVQWTVTSGLVHLNQPFGYSASAALAVDESRGWIVGNLFPTGSELAVAALWVNGVPMTLGIPPGGNFSKAWAIANGRIVGQWGSTVAGPQQGFIWEDGQMSDLGPILAAYASRACDISESGAVVGWQRSTPQDELIAFVLHGKDVTILGPISGGYTSEALGVNSATQTVGVGELLDDTTGDIVVRAFFWENGTMINLGTLPGFSYSAATDINDDGLVVGRLWGGPPGALIYQDGVMMDINDLISPDAGVQVRIANAVNNDGQITGWGVDLKGDSVAVVLSPIVPPLGDLTCDGIVFLDDFELLLKSWGPCPSEGGCPADLDGDGAVGIVDFLILLGNWG